MAKLDPEVLAHLEWIGFVRPTGLVVSAPALVRAGAILDRRDTEGQRFLRECVEDRTFDIKRGPSPCLSDFRRFAEAVLGWGFSPKAYAGTSESPIPDELLVPLSESGETLRPDFAVRELEPKDGASPWQLLVCMVDAGADIDQVVRGQGNLEASAHSRMERLLRKTGVPAGLIFSGTALRMISAPHGESSGWLDFRVADMVQTAGRPISTAIRLLLGETRLLSLPRPQRLGALLVDSRKFQSEVSERLAEQVLHALYELLRGFQSAHDASQGALLREILSEYPDEVYQALLTVILRLVFLLYAEERDMLPEDDTFLRYYSLAGLYERLREDAALFPDTMDQRYGAWTQLLVLFRMIHDGAESGSMRLPQRQGVLFDPDRFKFLEGRSIGGARQIHERIEPPLVPDGTVYRALEKLLVLDGERISYRALDVEQIGSVYETMMGFRLETTTGRSVAIKAQKKQGAPTAIDIEALFQQPGAKRQKWLQDRADRKLGDTVKKAATTAGTIEDLHAALLPVIDLAATPDLVPKGAMVLQPSQERRRSGSHYTPRALTEPIVRKTLEPIFARLREVDGAPRAAQILCLKVCDPAMGSGAFLVEVCRQLGDALVEAWHIHGELPTIPPDEDEVIFARRLVAQRCLYGVDRNPVAVDLAKMSLWLATLAKDHALTFVDHALRHGDSLVGLSRKQIEAFQWLPTGAVLRGLDVREPVDKVFELRRRIREADEGVTDWERRELWSEAQFELGKVRLVGDLVVAAFFTSQKPKDREAKRTEFASAVASGKAERYRGWLEECRHADPPLAPFHWEVEFPEVFDRDDAGFDAVIGNPPFLGGTRISTRISPAYMDYLKTMNVEAGDRADLVAYFFRRAFLMIRTAGAFGLIATNTIAQGDTRSVGLGWIRRHGGVIYHARRRHKWPGSAAVVVSIVHVAKMESRRPYLLDGHVVDRISAYLFHLGGDEEPSTLRSNQELCYSGVYPHGSGFQFDDTDQDATPVSTMHDLIRKNATNARIIHPYIGGQEILEDPRHRHVRFVINFEEMSLAEAAQWPDLLRILETKVKPKRIAAGGEVGAAPWWRFWRPRTEMLSALAPKTEYLAHPFTSSHLAFVFLPQGTLLAAPHLAFVLDVFGGFGILQSRLHECWVRFFASSLEDRLRYTPSDCFETFPSPQGGWVHPAVEAASKPYYEFRAALMLVNDEGLTKTYNRFHDPNHDGTGVDGRDQADVVRDIERLRKLHAAMDRAVLDAYGWADIPTDCQFLLDYEIEEEEQGDKKKPYRYRWPDEVRDEVMARLLELNRERAKEEGRFGAAATKKGKVPAKRGPKQADTKDLLS